MVEPASYRALYSLLRQEMESAFEADQLFAHVTGWHSYDLPHIGQQTPPESQQAQLASFLRRRLDGEPLQYLLGQWEFYGLPFAVGEGVLIPRADTETLVEAALEQAGKLGDTSPLRILDLCSGSGAVAVAVAYHLKAAVVTAVELSAAAFGYLEQNIKGNQVAVEAVQADLYEYAPTQPLHMITANPPYIPSGEIGGLQAEVQKEPRTALDGGCDGLDFYRGIVDRYQSWMAPGGCMLFEVGAGQAGDVSRIFRESGWQDVTQHRDLNGIDRVVAARWIP